MIIKDRVKKIFKIISLVIRKIKKILLSFYFKCKKNKYVYFFLKIAFFLINKIFRIIIKSKLSNREKRLRSIKIKPKVAEKQVNDLVRSLGNNSKKKGDEFFVSLIVLNRNGLGHLKRLLKSLKKNTQDHNYELIVIDNGSKDGSLEFLRENFFNLPIKLIVNKENVSFSKGCNQGADEAKGDFLVFMNNDIQVLPGWLENFMDCYNKNEGKVGSIGARLIYPSKKRFKLSNRLQHVGVKFEYDYLGKFYRPYNFGMGESVLDYKEIKEYPALTAALLFVPRKRFFEVGGFDEDYFYGYEDVDFGLKMNKAGYKNIFCPEVCAFHYEFGTQKKDDKNNILERRKNNIKLFKNKWNLYLIKNIFADRLSGKNFFGEETFSVHIVFDGKNDISKNTCQELGALMRDDFGFDVKFLSTKRLKFFSKIGLGADLVISFSSLFDPRSVSNKSPKLLKIAWAGGTYSEWISKEHLACFDLILSSSEILNKNILEIIKRNVVVKKDSVHDDFLSIIKEIENRNSKPRIAIKIATSNWGEAESWGDYHFSLSLEKCFRKKNWDAVVKILPDWDDDSDEDCLAVLVLRGLSFYKTKPHHYNVMWNISHPDMVKTEEYDSYDHVFIASRIWTEKIKKEVEKVEVESLLQCTDGDVFKVPEKEELIGINKEDILFVGNSRKEYRLSVKYAIENGFNVSVYGKLWEDFINKNYIKGTYLDNRSLYKHYYLSKILLNDHWMDMADKGFVSNRIFDGMASGAVILTDYVNGIEKEDFYDFLNIYKDNESFLDKTNYILKNKEECKKRALLGSELVIKNHTFEKRVDLFIEKINQNTFQE